MISAQIVVTYIAYLANKVYCQNGCAKTLEFPEHEESRTDRPYQMQIRILVFILISALNVRAVAYDPCEHNLPDDKGLRVLIRTVKSGNINLLNSQKSAKMLLTEVKGEPENVDVLKWCRCVYRKKLEKFGAEKAELMTALNMQSKYMEYQRKQSTQMIAEEYLTTQSFEASCYNEAQKNLKDERISTADFSRMMSAEFNSSKGVGAIELGSNYQKLISQLGPPFKTNKNNISENLYFGPLGVELIVVLMPPGPNGIVKGIQVNESYRGTTDSGLKIRDSVTAVKLKMAAIRLLVDTPNQLIFDNGMYFQFNNSTPKELITIGLVDSKTSEFQKMRQSKPAK